MSQPVRILILEDDPELQEVLSTVLSAEGYEVVATSRGEEAIEKAHEQPFDLVVADIRMEGMDGLEALERVQQDSPDIRSLVVTGYSTEADSIRAIRLGVGDYLKKPFSLEEFLDSVNALVAQRREELRRREEERRLRQALLWAMRSLAASVGRGITGLAEQAGRLAGATGLTEEAVESVQLAVLLRALQTYTEDNTPDLPPQVVRVLNHLDENWDGSGGPEGLAGEGIPLESRVARVALAAWEGQLERSEEFDPAVVAALSSTVAESSEVWLEAQQRRGLVSLGRAFEQAGQAGNAREVFLRLLADAGPSRERVEAGLGLARLAMVAGNRLEAAERATDAARTGVAVGPVVAAAASLEGGLLLRGDPRGVELVRLAGRLYRQLGLEEGEATAVLALARLAQPVEHETLVGATQVLLRPESSPRLARSSEWLLQYLLETDLQEPDLERLRRRLLREAPRALVGLLRRGELTSRARIQAARLLGAAGGSRAALQLLAADGDPQVRQEATRQLSGAEESVERPPLRIYSMGPLEVYNGDERVQEGDWKTQKVKYLFARLAVNRGLPVPEDQLIESFWPDDVEKGKRNLYWSTSVLRKILRSPDSVDPVIRKGGNLSLNPDIPRWHDYEELDDLVSGQPSEPERFRRVLELYRGPYLEGCYLDWAVEIRNRLEKQVGDILAGLADWAHQREQHQECLEFARRLLEVDPYRQEAHLWVMQSCLALGRPEEAVRQFNSCSKVLKRDLGMEPSIKLLEFHQRALLSLSQ